MTGNQKGLRISSKFWQNMERWVISEHTSYGNLHLLHTKNHKYNIVHHRRRLKCRLEAVFLEALGVIPVKWSWFSSKNNSWKELNTPSGHLASREEDAVERWNREFLSSCSFLSQFVAQIERSFSFVIPAQTCDCFKIEGSYRIRLSREAKSLINFFAKTTHVLIRLPVILSSVNLKVFSPIMLDRSATSICHQNASAEV